MGSIRNFVMDIDLKEMLNKYKAQKKRYDGGRDNICKCSLLSNSYLLVELSIYFSLGMHYGPRSYEPDFYFLDFFIYADIAGKSIGAARENLLSMDHLTEQDILSLTNEQLWNMIVERL